MLNNGILFALFVTLLSPGYAFLLPPSSLSSLMNHRSLSLTRATRPALFCTKRNFAHGQAGRISRIALHALTAEATNLDDVPHVTLQAESGQPIAPEKLPAEWDKAGVYACFDREGFFKFVGMSRKVSVSIVNHLQVLGADECYAAKVMVWDAPTKDDLEGTAKAWIQQCMDATGGPPPGNTREVEEWRYKAKDIKMAKESIQFSEGVDEDGAEAEIKRLLAQHKVILFQKGTRQFPQCGFSEATIGMMDATKVEYESIDCLDEERNPGLRDAIKTFSQWPTIPQVYANGEFLGGADIIRELAENGELKSALSGESQSSSTEGSTSEVAQAKEATYKTISPEETYARMKAEDYKYVDVRTEGEFQASNVPGSVLIPAFVDTPNGRVPVQEKFVSEIQRRYPDRSSRLALGCRSGVRSKTAAQWLCDVGYTDLLEVDGGFMLWSANTKLPTRQGVEECTFSTVSAAEAYEKIQSEGYEYVDVRTEGEYKGGKVPGSVLISAFAKTSDGMVPTPTEFLAEIQKRFPDRSSKLVVSCASGKRSNAACGWLCELGYSNLIEVEGGYGGWSSNKDLPTET